MPVIKTARDRDALRKAATSGESCYFLGTDSAPHPYARKVNVNGIPGMFNSPVAIETYAKVFEEEGALDKLEAFAAINGAAHYRLPVNTETITLEKTAWVAPEEIKIEEPDERAIVYRGGETIEWKVVNA
jgi:dihydroorotase